MSTSFEAGRPEATRNRHVSARIAVALVLLVGVGIVYPTTAQAVVFTVNTTDDEVDVTLNGTCLTANGKCSLRAAIQEANNTAAKDVIKLKAKTYNLLILGTTEQLSATGDFDITEDLDLKGPKGKLAMVDGNDLDRVFDIVGLQTNVTFKNIGVTNGTSPGSEEGGGIRNTGVFTMTGGKILGNNISGGYGGGLINLDGGATLNNVRIEGNQGDYGGGVYNNSDTQVAELTINGGVISNNIANSSGGGVYNFQGITNLNSVKIAGNITESCCGGGVANEWGQVTINKGLIHNNDANDGRGGGVYNDGSSNPAKLVMNGTRVTRNSAFGENGGGIYNDGGTANLRNVTVHQNSVVGGYCCGGGISNDNGKMKVLNSRVTDNLVTAGLGGGIHNDGTTQFGTLTISNTTISGNKATGGCCGGGVYNLNGSVKIDRSKVLDNAVLDSGGYGGGIYSEGTVPADALLTVTRTLVKDNWAKSCCGGGIANYKATAEVDKSTIDSNEASGCCGGGVLNEGGMLTVTDSTISNNEAFQRVATGGGGGIWNGFAGGLPGVAAFVNSTISGNDSFNPGGGIFTGFAGTDMLTLTNVTITGNKSTLGGGGIHEDGGTTELIDSIVANSGVGDCAGTIDSGGHNVIEDLTGCTLTGATGSNVTGQDPKLGPLAGNGGPTKTHALKNGSPALNLATSGCPPPAKDQRGKKRKAGKCDSGAYERQPS